MRKIQINLDDNSYNIYIEKNIIHNIGNYLNERFKGKKVSVITDYNVENLHGKALMQSLNEKGFKTQIISIKPGEASKSLESLQAIYKSLSDFRISREDLIITFGGGVVGDLGGYAAATYLRGIPYIGVPTTLLAQVDSSIGGKVAIDLPWGKNLVGSFYHPKAVFIDPQLLRTLNKKFLHDGLAEVIKYGCIKNENIISKLLIYKDDDELLNDIEEIIYACCSIKKSMVEMDEKDFGERMLLNFGHTLGHAIEKYYDYKRFTHGEAVGIGMYCMTQNCEVLHITEKNTSTLIKQVLQKYELPYEAAGMDESKIFDSITLDKKSNGDTINLVMLRKIGEGFIKNISIKDIDNYIDIE